MIDWKNSTALVTGATGLVGSWLCRELLHRGARVVALVHATSDCEFYRSGTADRCTIVNGALEDYSAVLRAINENDVNVVFHLGAQAIVGTALRDPLGTFEANIRGTYHVLEACRRLSALVKAVVIASSDKAYGDSDVLPYTEDLPLKGRHPYDVSKSCADMLAHTYAHTYSLPVIIARCGNIYGGGDLNWSRIVPGTIRSILFNQRPVIRSNGSPLRDYVYVEDIVDAYILLAEEVFQQKLIGEAFNFSPESPVGVNEIVAQILKAMNSSLEPLVLDNAAFEIQDQGLSSRKAADALKWKSKWSLPEGLAKTTQWYKAYFEIDANA